MFTNNREFKAVIFAFARDQFPRLKSVKQIARLFPEDSVLDKPTILPGSLKDIEIAYIDYYSSRYFPRSEDEQIVASLRVEINGQIYFKYRVYLLVDKSADHLQCLVAVPYTGLGKEVFSSLHKACGMVRPLYRRLDLRDALKLLRAGHNDQSRIRVRQIELPFPDTDEKIDHLSLFGKDVVNSNAFKTGAGILKIRLDEMEPDSCQFCYDTGKRQNFNLSVDKQGYIAIRITKNLSVLEDFFHLLRFFASHHVTTDVIEWPWRGGVLEKNSED